MWQFDVYADTGGHCRWRLFASNGRNVASSGESFASHSNAHGAAARFKANARSAYHFEVYADSAGNYRWRTKASNGQTDASSGQAFASSTVARAAADNVKANAGAAELL